MQERYLGWEKVSCLEVSSVQECPHRERGSTVVHTVCIYHSVIVQQYYMHKNVLLYLFKDKCRDLKTL